MSIRNYCEARDYLLTTLIFDNVSRPGAISNMSLGKYKRATERDNGYMIIVIKHKTPHKGPASIACTQSLFREIGIYVKYLWDKIEGMSTDQADIVFVSWKW